MRTTVELPPYLMRAAKAKSAERGESLKALLTRAVEAEVGVHASTGPKRKRVTFPMIQSDPNAPKVNITNDFLAQVEADEEADRYHRSFPDLDPRKKTGKKR
jgi:hypothetical protein